MPCHPASVCWLDKRWTALEGYHLYKHGNLHHNLMKPKMNGCKVMEVLQGGRRRGGEGGGGGEGSTGATVVTGREQIETK